MFPRQAGRRRTRKARAVHNPSVRESPDEPGPPQLRRVLQFRCRDWSQFDQSQSSCQGLGETGHQGRRDGSHQQESPVAASVSVDRAAEAGEELRPGLRLVEYDQVCALREALPADVDSQPVGFLFDVKVLPSERCRQCRFPALPGSDQGHGRIGGEATAQDACDLPWNHACKTEIRFCFASIGAGGLPLGSSSPPQPALAPGCALEFLARLAQLRRQVRLWNNTVASLQIPLIWASAPEPAAGSCVRPAALGGAQFSFGSATATSSGDSPEPAEPAHLLWVWGSGQAPPLDILDVRYNRLAS